MDGGRFPAQLVSSKISKDEIIMKPISQNELNERINVDEPLWDQKYYMGRWKHFAFITDCRTIFSTEARLCEAKRLCEDYKAGREPKETTRDDIIWAKKLKDSSFHPDNGELMNVIGRMSFQLPGSLILTAGMLAYCKTAKAVVGWQILNQGFNAIVNYTNRNASNENQDQKIKIQEAFLMATAAGCAAALGFRKIMSRRGNLMQHWAPFVAVAAGNMVNLPIMRQNEIKNGIDITAKESTKAIMKSKVSAMKGISECVISRIVMAAPGMLLIPVIINSLRPYCFYQIRPWLNLPVQNALCGIFLIVMIPTALAIYPQRSSMRVKTMRLFCRKEYEEYEKLTNGIPEVVYYNKGL